MMKPEYHITPEYGFLNDPNGLAQFNGKYHVFYQWLPEVTPQGNKRWRHCESDDLIHWKDKGCVLEPKEWFDKNGCYSGSGVRDHGRYYLFYTGNVKNEAGERETYQCAAVSEDGSHFTKIGPVAYLPEAYTPHFRDPKVWHKNGRWWMMVGAQTKKLKGNVALYVSDNLKEWQWLGNMLDESLDWGYMCECPDIIESEQQDFLIVSRQKEDGCRAMAFAGKMDYETGRFQIEGHAAKYLDEGMDFYAPQSFVDEKGRCLLFGWLGSGEIDYQMSQPAVKEGWLHSLTIPREIHVVDGELCQRPVEELKALRKQEQDVLCCGKITIDRESSCMEIYAKELIGKSISFDIGGVLKINYVKDTQTFRVLRKRWDVDGYDERMVFVKELEDLHIFLDHCTGEIFVNEGKTVLTMKAYFGVDTKIQVSSDEQIEVQTWLLEVK